MSLASPTMPGRPINPLPRPTDPCLASPAAVTGLGFGLATEGSPPHAAIAEASCSSGVIGAAQDAGLEDCAPDVAEATVQSLLESRCSNGWVGENVAGSTNGYSGLGS